MAKLRWTPHDQSLKAKIKRNPILTGSLLFNLILVSLAIFLTFWGK